MLPVLLAPHSLLRVLSLPSAYYGKAYPAILAFSSDVFWSVLGQEVLKRMQLVDGLGMVFVDWTRQQTVSAAD